jgi:hypothetical protein
MEFEPLTSHTKGEHIVINHFITYRQCVILFTLQRPNKNNLVYIELSLFHQIFTIYANDVTLLLVI